MNLVSNLWLPSEEKVGALGFNRERGVLLAAIRDITRKRFSDYSLIQRTLNQAEREQKGPFHYGGLSKRTTAQGQSEERKKNGALKKRGRTYF